MLGLELIMAGWLNTQVTPVKADIACHTKTPPRINIKPSKSRVRYDFTRTKAQLNNVDVDTVSPYGPQHNTEVSGLMSGSIQVKHEISFIHERYESLNLGCVHVRNVDVDVHIEPIIYVAREHPKGSCMHSAVMAHERKHVREDQLIVNKYSKLIGQAMQQTIESQGSGFGPYELYKLPVIQTNVQNSLNTVIRKYNDRMNEERRRRQQAIDSYEEYESIGERCEDNKR